MKATTPPAAPSTRDAQPLPPAADAPLDELPAAGRRRRPLRELLESLPLVDQLRVVVVLAVVVSILLLHVIVAATQVVGAIAPSIAQHAATGDADSLGVLAKLPGVTSVTIMLPSGEVFSPSVRTTGDAAQDASQLSPENGASGKSWLRSLGEVLALRATVLSLPVQLSVHGAATALVTSIVRVLGRRIPPARHPGVDVADGFLMRCSRRTR
jgi:hypothetical protein